MMAPAANDMESTVNEPHCCGDDCISSKELLHHVPSSEHMQEELQNAAEFVQIMHEDPRGLAVLIEIGRRLETLPGALEHLLRNTLVLAIGLGNFCNAGGRIVFLDPPEPQNSSTPTSEIQTQKE